MKLVALGLMLAITAGCAARVPVSPSVGPAVARVFVIDRGWHTDIGLAVSDVRPPLAALAADFPGVRYLLFGFGDRAYLLSPHHTLFGDFSALLPGRGALLITALRAPPSAAFGARQVVSLPISTTGIEQLNAFLWKQFEPDSRGRPIQLAAGPYLGSAYYASPTTYDAFFTCNSWAADALRAAGIPVSDTGIVLAAQLMDQVRWIGRAESSDRADVPSAVGN